MAEDINSKESSVSSSSSSGSSKKSSNTVLIIVLVVLVVLGVGGYLVSHFLVKKVAEKTAEGIIGAATGAQVDINGAKWPSDIPAPKYSSGKIESSIKLGTGSSQSWSVTISGTSQAQYDAYKKDVEAAGWTSASTADFGVTISQYTKDSYDLTATFDPSSNGVSLTVTVKQ